MAAVTPARKAAFQILLAIERGQSHSDDLLRSRAVDAFSQPDRHLATALVLGVLRWQIRLDHQVQALLARPNANLDPEVRVALRLGAFQLLHMDRIPARAAIDESVELAKQAGHRFASGMVNAVLRRLAVAAPAEFLEESPAEIALAQAHPEWMVERWTSFYGIEAARAICRHGQSQPMLSIRLENPAVADELAQAGIRLEPGELLTAARKVVTGDISATVAFRQGRVRIQDEGSQLVAEIAGQGSAVNSDHPVSILDACAAPGGKTLILAERNPQARIVACESSAPRFEQLRQRVASLGDRVECRLCDASGLPQSSCFDFALVDAPCSGTGTLGRNPEIRHRLCFEDLPRHAERQRAILLAAMHVVRPGGRVVYSTCSLEPEENEQVVAAVLAENANVRLIPLAPRIDSLLNNGILTISGAEHLLRCLTAGGALQILPGVFHSDGFFIAILDRASVTRD